MLPGDGVDRALSRAPGPSQRKKCAGTPRGCTVWGCWELKWKFPYTNPRPTMDIPVYHAGLVAFCIRLRSPRGGVNSPIEVASCHFHNAKRAVGLGHPKRKGDHHA